MLPSLLNSGSVPSGSLASMRPQRPSGRVNVVVSRRRRRVAAGLIGWAVFHSAIFHCVVCCCAVSSLAAGGATVAQDTSRGDHEGGQDRALKFVAMGDVPYSLEESAQLEEQIRDLPQDADFLIHLGDIKRGLFPCLGFLYQDVAEKLQQSRIPALIIPGDNEWNDCPRPEAGWQHWKKHLLDLPAHWDLPFKLRRQTNRQENFAFTHQRVLFVGLNLVGGRVLDEAAWEERLNDNADWVAEQLEQHGGKVEAVVLFTHAGPGEQQTVFFDRFHKSVQQFAKPVLLLHGDGHRWIKDRPLPAKNVLRVQVDQGGKAPPLLIEVTPGRADPFRFDRRQ